MKRKVEVVKQTSIKDCGPACLLSIIKYYGGYVPLERIKLDTKTNKEGTSAYDILRAASSYGFDVIGYKFTSENLFEESRMFPMIVHIMLKDTLHYIVLYQIEGTNVVLMDPAIGKKVMQLEDFLELWTGYTLEFFPRRNILIMKKENKLIEIIYTVFSKEKKILKSIFISSLLFTILTILCSYYFKLSIESLNEDSNKLYFYSFLFFSIIILKSIFYYIKIKYISFFNKNLDTRLFSEFIFHLFNIPSKAIGLKSLGEIVTRLNDLKNVKEFISEFIVTIFIDFSLMLIAIPIFIYISFDLFIILLAMLIIYLIIGLVYSKIIFGKVIENLEYETKFNTVFLENINMISNIKTLNKNFKVLKKLEVSLSNYLFNSFNIFQINNSQSFLKNIINEISLFLINCIGFFLIIEEKLSVADLVTFNTLLGFFVLPIKNLIDNIPKYNYIKASIYKLKEFMNIEKENFGYLEKLKSFKIEFKNVSFSYIGIENNLNNINFIIDEGEHVLLSGKSGCGKSTICKFLLKEEKVGAGYIYLSEININDLSLKTIRENIVYVGQSEFLFSDTVKNNIVFYNNFEINKFNLVCDICKVNEIVEEKVLRYESFVEASACNFSGGEVQRMLLARACYNDFNVLIIDEALSEVDLKTEVEIIKNIKKHFKDKIIIYISHKNVNKYFKKVITLD